MPKVCVCDQVYTDTTDIWLDCHLNTALLRATRSYGNGYITSVLSSPEPRLYLAFPRERIRRNISRILRSYSNIYNPKALCGENMRRTGKGNIRLSITGQEESVISEKFKWHKRG